MDFDSRYFCPSLSQASSGHSGLSPGTTLPVSGSTLAERVSAVQENALYPATDFTSGLSIHVSGSLMSAPPWGFPVAPSVGVAEGLAPPDGDAVPLGDAVPEGSGDLVLSSSRKGGRLLPVFFLVGAAVGLAEALGASTPPPGETEGDGSADPLGDGPSVVVALPAPGPVIPTTRNRSWACRLTVSTRSRRDWPGISTTTYWLPSVVTSASETPEPLTRWSMMPA